MGSAAFKRKLVHRATFLEPTETRSSSGEIIRTWAPVDNGCGGTVWGLFLGRRHEIAMPWVSFQMSNAYRWLCDSREKGYVTEEHRVRNIVDEDGDAVAEANGTWSVDALIPRRARKLHHYELELEKIE
jgi:hypothetical protein